MCALQPHYGSNGWLRRFNVHDHGVADVAFSDDEKLLATVGDIVDKQIYVWDMSNGAVVANKFASPDPTDVICWGGHEKGMLLSYHSSSAS